MAIIKEGSRFGEKPGYAFGPGPFKAAGKGRAQIPTGARPAQVILLLHIRMDRWLVPMGGFFFSLFISYGTSTGYFNPPLCPLLLSVCLFVFFIFFT